MTTIRESRFAAIDFESAGAVRGATDQPVQVGIAVWTFERGITDSFVSYLQANGPVQWTARKVHGISDADLTDAPTLLSLWPEFRDRLRGAVVVAHGRGTEKRFLRSFPGHGFGPWADTLQIARAVWPQAKSHTLSSLGHMVGIEEEIRSIVPGRGWHDALFDSVASLLVLSHVIREHSLAESPVELLLSPNTSEWHRLRHV